LIRAIPWNIPDTEHTVVCEKHGLPLRKQKGTDAARFTIKRISNIAPSQIPTTVIKQRNNSNVLMANGLSQADELPEFETQDNMTYNDIDNIVINNIIEHAVCITVSALLWRIPSFFTRIQLTRF
jgi:hypothetical protein